jgi:protein SCO1
VTQRRLRQISIAGTLVLLALVSALSILARVRQSPSTASIPTGTPSPLAVGTALQRPRPVPAITLTDESGRSVSTTSWRGKWVILAPSMTLCHEVCPMTSAAFDDVISRLRKAGLSNQVVVAEVTIDPWRDSPARLRAYRRLTGVNFTLLTGAQGQISRLWKFFGVYYKRVPQGHPPDVDWMTHKPERFDVAHTDALFFIDPNGRERIISVGMPDVGGRLSVTLRSLLSDVGQRNLAHPELPWTATQAIQDLYYLMGRNVPASATPSVSAPSRANAQRALAGSPSSLAALHRQAGRLLGSASDLTARLGSLRGYPVVINAWASWCGPCRGEFPIFAALSARYGRRVAFLGVDTNDSLADARAFLAQHPVSYPSYHGTSSQLSSLAQLEGMPTTIYLDRNGKVIGTHIGQYATSAALQNDIEHYALGVRG